MKMKKTLKQIVSGVLTLTMLSSILPSIPTAAADTSFTYPYTMFAASDSEGAITVNAGNFCVNGNVATNGTIVSSGNMNINGTRTEYAGEDMIYILKKLDYAYFSSDNVETYIDDYSYSETNINITEPLEVGGTLELTGNINLNSGIKAVEDVNINGEVKNSNNAVICSETGDINIYTTNVSFNGLIYAPFGDIVIDSDNLNLNNAILIAQTITLDCPNVNANYNSTMAEIVGTESDTDIELFAVGSYDEDANAIDIEWQSNYGNSTYEIFCSDDNINYTSVATVTGSTEYQYLITEDFEKRYFKVVLTTNYGETIEAIPFVVTKDEYDYYDVELLDSDADELPDVLEIAIGTRTDLADTDGDTLTDYQEVYITGTDPTVYDSVAEGVSDADADCDSDGLSNSYEIELGSDPCSENSDEDDLNDYDEVYIYGTDPAKTDTDDDTISDSSEIKLGLDPNDPQTFGVPDSEYIFSQVIASDSEILSEINTEESPYTLSIELDTNMYAEDEVTAEISGYSKAIENDAMLGNGVDIAISDVCTPENIVIKYTIKDAFLDNTDGTFSSLPEFQGIRRLNVFKLDTETNMLLPIETQFDDDNNVLYAEVDEFGTYCIMDMEIWLKNIGVKYKNDEDEISDITLNIDNINLLSDETSMPKTSYNFKGSTYAVYDITGMSWEEANAYCNSLGGHLVTITTSEEQAFINNNLLTNCANNLYWIGGKQVNSEWKWVTNENFYFTNWASGEPTNTANEYYIHMYGKKGRTDISIGQWNNTFNINDTVSSNFYASSHCGFICEWDDNNSANKTYDIFVPTKWKTITLDGELNAVNLIDTDSDSLTDWDEVNTELLVWNDDGSFELPEFSVSTYMVNCARYNTPIYDFLNNESPVKYLPILSDPTEEDSDGDGLLDGKSLFYNGKPLAPVDPKPLLYTGNRNLWKTHIEEIKNNYVTSFEYSYDYYEMDDLELGLRFTDTFIPLPYFNNNLLEMALTFATKNGSTLLDFRYDDKHIALHSDTTQWQSLGGYNDFYDWVFDYATDMRRLKLEFESDSQNYVIWAWKGNYMLLGAGSEVGFYTQGSTLEEIEEFTGLEQWMIADELPMTLSLYSVNSKGLVIDSYYHWLPDEEQWWITGFVPDIYDYGVKADELIQIASVDLSDMYNEFKKSYSPDDSNMVTSLSDETPYTLIFDDTEETVWICW